MAHSLLISIISKRVKLLFVSSFFVTFISGVRLHDTVGKDYTHLKFVIHIGLCSIYTVLLQVHDFIIEFLSIFWYEYWHDILIIWSLWRIKIYKYVWYSPVVYWNQLKNSFPLTFTEISNLPTYVEEKKNWILMINAILSQYISD